MASTIGTARATTQGSWRPRAASCTAFPSRSTVVWAEAMVATPDGSAPARPAGYGAIAASNGIASLLLVVVVILMIWKP